MRFEGRGEVGQLDEEDDQDRQEEQDAMYFDHEPTIKADI